MLMSGPIERALTDVTTLPMVNVERRLADVTTMPLGKIEPAIEIIDLCKQFKQFKAVDHLSLTVRQGEIFGLLGPNGSGKTTTINMISGLSVPTSGRVTILGHDVLREARQV